MNKYQTDRKIALVTGSTDGIGKQTALGLASKGFNVIVTGRNADKGNAMLAELESISPLGKYSFYAVDFSSQKSIKDFATNINNDLHHLDVLVNNVGLLTSKRRESEDGIELMFAVNYLSAFLLTHLLLDKLKNSDCARIVNVTGGAYKFGKINFDDINMVKRFNSLKALGQAKLANILFTYEAERMWAKFGIHSIAVDPGAAKTPGHKEHSNYLLKMLLPLIGTSTKEAAYSSIEAATSLNFEGTGGFFLNKRGKPQLSSSASRDRSTAILLWKKSNDILNITL